MVLGLLAIIGIGNLYAISMEYIIYVTLSVLIVDIAVVILSYRNYKRNQVTELMTTYSEDEDDEELHKRREAKEKEDFFVMWAHQVKTPIAALNLLFQSDNIDIQTCKQEVFQIENYVEMALGYLRFEGMSSDLALDSYSLEVITRQVIKKYATVFINKHLSVEIRDIDIKVLTDEKWFALVLEQIVSNALKYTKEGGISIWSEKNDSIELHIKDSGIGITKEDLPRIFEKGFTGYNGRVDKKASGIGLYLAKGICEKLGHEICIESVVGVGTEVIITFGKEKVNSSDLTKL